MDSPPNSDPLRKWSGEDRASSDIAERAGLISAKGGSVFGPEHGPAFTHVSPRSMPLPVLIAVPHAGRIYPGEALANMRDPELSQLRLEDRHVDQLGVAVAKQTGTGLLVAHAPRAMLDLNRSKDDVDWDMVADAKRHMPRHSATNRRARSGLGLVPRRLPGFGEIWRNRLSQEELDARIDNIHRPYHAFLGRELERIRSEWGAALLIDLHSMPPLRAQSGQERAPQVVLGDRFGASCHGNLIARAFRHLETEACPCAHNRPYSGGYVLDRHASPSRGIHAIQVEVCRATYLDDRLAEPSANLPRVARMLAALVRELGAETARLGRGSEFAQAAE
ncbi:N-formylglutamate amidohydrolase [uncultured Erythrobacter sp.]|uniref:N-formylglutamate amidohydrolase n=1 Tax=uncultured Erythrobacter sp. TaxID=263913 RepID=UPI002638F5DF|nr:N-formylglutamate amidohydrolase [uncultured Erythrobacter sp.]